MAGRWTRYIRYIAPGGTIPYRPSIFDIQDAHAPLCPPKTQRDKVLAANAGRPICPSKPLTLCSERQLKRPGGE